MGNNGQSMIHRPFVYLVAELSCPVSEHEYVKI